MGVSDGNFKNSDWLIFFYASSFLEFSEGQSIFLSLLLLVLIRLYGRNEKPVGLLPQSGKLFK
ncbi:hypothetical protein REIFOR_01969 [Reinekea forsetii]|uniref:Uncharacterized protein n=1 Tax=Reinekea forsetii TaxID=1336806 RepID=A0A2K8KWQ0_9GAMM|nr:hypothetical protein REIFOR_01969 [Reinekea forsetii]